MSSVRHISLTGDGSQVIVIARRSTFVGMTASLHGSMLDIGKVPRVSRSESSMLLVPYAIVAPILSGLRSRSCHCGTPATYLGNVATNARISRSTSASFDRNM
jgi:hypothetical protein